MNGSIYVSKTPAPPPSCGLGARVPGGPGFLLSKHQHTLSIGQISPPPGSSTDTIQNHKFLILFRLGSALTLRSRKDRFFLLKHQNTLAIGQISPPPDSSTDTIQDHKFLILFSLGFSPYVPGKTDSCSLNTSIRPTLGLMLRKLF